ncbi:methyltransferase domain-containing protein [Aquimarina hainanensis]|uniref:Methyltransferase domain-containing protein n=1 Tax=Aquimarina hainanensis TaxID=1578017 RepID=A0ABW5N7L9_9FLAO|nr:methyltransferase domain-containing protein [Aquimarina sp. TRL1]QKX05683.1 SAM-dependent methyltransferase [Aquimarina sp. TRL1]
MGLDQEYWNNRYQNKLTGWDIGQPSPPITQYFEQLQNKALTILIPGGGNGYEAEFLYKNGFRNTYLLDFSEEALSNFKSRVPEFPDTHLICDNFFNLKGKFDLLIEQTFFCALDPKLRENYAQQVSKLLTPTGKIIGVLFSRHFDQPGPPFGGNINEYKALFSKHLTIKTLAPCYNSILPRKNNELFFIFTNYKE